MNEFKSPNKITSIITHQKFQNEYIFYFRVISDDKEIKFLNNNNGENKNEIEINNNLKFECENDLPEVFLTKGDIIYDNVENQQTPICTVIFKKNSQSFQVIFFF